MEFIVACKEFDGALFHHEIYEHILYPAGAEIQHISDGPARGMPRAHVM